MQSTRMFAACLVALLTVNASGQLIVTSDNCLDVVPPSAWNFQDVGGGFFDVNLLELWQPFGNTFFEVHPINNNISINALIIDVDGPPAGSPIIVRVLEDCEDPDNRFQFVQSIIETGTGETLLNLVDIDADLGTIVEAIGDVFVGGNITGDIIGTTPDNAIRGVNNLTVDGGVFGNVRAPEGRVAFLIAGGDIGTVAFPVDIEAKHEIIVVSSGNDIYANINSRVTPGGAGTMTRVSAVRFVGSLTTTGITPSGGVTPAFVKCTEELDADITIGGPYTGSNVSIEMPVGGLQRQIIINADNLPGAMWTAPVKVGFDGDPGQIILTGPGYTETAATLGGGSVGLAPFALHDESCDPPNNSLGFIPTGNLAQVKLRHYGPIGIGAAPLTIERRLACTTDDFETVSLTEFTMDVDVSDDRSLLVPEQA